MLFAVAWMMKNIALSEVDSCAWYMIISTLCWVRWQLDVEDLSEGQEGRVKQLAVYVLSESTCSEVQLDVRVASRAGRVDGVSIWVDATKILK